ncbi:hypothetical protein J2W48_000615 [Flavobacterium piscis]|uniref:DUF2268 domain-containing protein n=1 Tax=Flavobacterium piscis TaxID=1114874 RepID=A0ABU1Y3A8_9FLAO|nr:hypothetical protein [Flavobacterium piscis]
MIDKLTGKAKCLNDLLNKNGDSFVQKLLANFAGKSEFNIEIVSKEKVISNETKLEINGITNHIIGSNLMTIEISIAKANENSALETARVILHEYIHADMFRKLNTIKDIKSQEIIDFKSTYNAYEKEKGHATMATLYINNMKEALKAFHKNVLPDDYKKYIDYYGVPPSDEFYEAFAWGGLKDSKVKPWTDLSPERKAAIEALASRAKNFSKIVLSCSN